MQRGKRQTEDEQREKRALQSAPHVDYSLMITT